MRILAVLSILATLCVLGHAADAAVHEERVEGAAVPGNGVGGQSKLSLPNSVT